MRKIAFLMATLVAASMVGTAPVHARDDRSAKIKRLQAEQKIAEANAQAAAETQRAYEEAWRKTKLTAKGAACVAGGLFAGPVIGVACLADAAYRNK